MPRQQVKAPPSRKQKAARERRASRTAPAPAGPPAPPVAPAPVETCGTCGGPATLERVKDFCYADPGQFDVQVWARPCGHFRGIVARAVREGEEGA